MQGYNVECSQEMIVQREMREMRMFSFYLIKVELFVTIHFISRRVLHYFDRT